MTAVASTTQIISLNSWKRTVAGLISYNGDLAYIEEVNQLVWENNNLKQSPQTKETPEGIIWFMHHPQYMATVELVRSTKDVKVNLTDDLTWNTHSISFI